MLRMLFYSFRRPRGVPRWSGVDFDARVAELQFVIGYPLGEEALRDLDNQHLLKVLRGHHQRGELLPLLEEPLVAPPNDGVERRLRPAVIARKMS
jgi:hypothetical protein